MLVLGLYQEPMTTSFYGVKNPTVPHPIAALSAKETAGRSPGYTQPPPPLRISFPYLGIQKKWYLRS